MSFTGQVISRRTQLSPHRDYKNECVGGCLDQLHSSHLICVNSCANSEDPNESAPLLADEIHHQIWRVRLVKIRRIP